MTDGDTPAGIGDDQLALLASLVPDAAVVVDEAGTILAANERVRELFGHEVADLVGRAVETIVPERYRHLHRQHRADYVVAPRARTMGAGLDLWGRRRDGTEVPVDISLAPLRTTGGLRVVAAVRDVSAQRAMAATEAQLAAIVRSSADAIVSTDVKGFVTSWNPGAERLLGYGAAEIVGRHVSTLVPEEHSEDLEVLLSSARAGEAVPPRDTRWRRRDGTLADFAVSVSALTSADGRPMGFSALLRDATDRKRAEAELRRLLREEQLRERQQSAMATIRLALLSGVATDEVLRSICDHAGDLFDADLALIATRGAFGMSVEATSEGADGRAAALLADPLVAAVRERGKPAVADTPAAGGPADALRAVLCAPIVSEKVLVGVLVVARTAGSRRDADPGDLVTAESLADQAALALQLDDARRARERLVLVADRERIARDLHDLVIQRLFAVGMMLQGSMRLSSDEHVVSRVNAAVDDLDATIREIRTVIFELGTPPAERPGLRSEVLEIASRTADSLGFDPVVHFEGPVDSAVPEDVVPHLLAVVGEALSNVARHAHAAHAAVEVAAAGGHVRVVVEDDGDGIGDTTRSSGLGNLRERAESLGGHLEVRDRPGGGTRLVWSAPLTVPAGDAARREG